MESRERGDPNVVSEILRMEHEDRRAVMGKCMTQSIGNKFTVAVTRLVNK